MNGEPEKRNPSFTVRAQVRAQASSLSLSLSLSLSTVYYTDLTLPTKIEVYISGVAV